MEDMVARVRGELGDEGKIIVYCKRASKFKAFAEKLGCEAYHTKTRTRARRCWSSGKLSPCYHAEYHLAKMLPRK